MYILPRKFSGEEQVPAHTKGVIQHEKPVCSRHVQYIPPGARLSTALRRRVRDLQLITPVSYTHLDVYKRQVRILGTVLVLNVFHQGLNAVWTCMVAENTARGVLYLIRYLRGRWKPPEFRVKAAS